MSEFVQEKYGSFIKDIKNYSYTLKDNQLFSLSQYKIFNNQTQSLFVKCQKVQRNGKIKLVYYVEEYENILDIQKEIDEYDYYKICNNLISGMLEIEDNGFLDICNVVMEPDMIYVEKETLKVKLLYIPINIELGTAYNVDSVIRNILLKITDANLYLELWERIKYDDLEKLQKWFQEKKCIKENQVEKTYHQLSERENKKMEQDYEMQDEKIEVQMESTTKEQKKIWKIVGMVSGIIVLGVVILGYASGLKWKKNSIPEPTVTPTSEPTVTPTSEPTATPTSEPTATPEPTATSTPIPKLKQKQEVVEETPQQDNSISNNVAPPQIQQNAAPPVEQKDNPAQQEENGYEGLDDFIIVE